MSILGTMKGCYRVGFAASALATLVFADTAQTGSEAIAMPVLSCQIDQICTHSDTCRETSRRFQVARLSSGEAETREVRGTTVVSRERWQSLTPYWLLRHPDEGTVEMLYLSFDMSFLRVTMQGGGPRYRVTDEQAKRGGPVSTRHGTVSTLTGVCG